MHLEHFWLLRPIWAAAPFWRPWRRSQISRGVSITPLLRVWLWLIDILIKFLCLGGVYSNHFDYSPLLPEDLPGFIYILIFLMITDALSLCFACIALKSRCNINIMAVFIFQHREFGGILAVQTCMALMSNFYYVSVSNGNDPTGLKVWLQPGYVNATGEDPRFSTNINEFL